MSEEQKKDSIGGDVPPENNQTQANQNQSENVSLNSQSNRDDEKINWRKVREEIDELRRENQELKMKTPKDTPKEEAFSYSPDDIPTFSDVDKLLEKRASQIAEKLYVERERKRAYEEIPSKYSDFQDVIKYVDDYVAENPAAVDAIKASANPRLTAYQMVKSWYKYRDIVRNENSSGDAKKVKENLSKPQSAQANYASAPLNEISSYTRMTAQKAAEVRKLAEEYASRR